MEGKDTFMFGIYFSNIKNINYNMNCCTNINIDININININCCTNINNDQYLTWWGKCAAMNVLERNINSCISMNRDQAEEKKLKNVRS